MIISIDKLITAIEIFDKKDRLESVKLIPRGIYLDEELIGRLSAKYARQLKLPHTEANESAKSEIRRIIGKQQYYLGEGDRCRVGYFVRGDFSLLETICSTSEAKMTSCRDYINPNDPLFKKNKEIELVLKGDMVAIFNLLHGNYGLHNHTLSRFKKRVKTSKKKKRKVESENLRGYLNTLFQLFKGSVPSSRKYIVDQFFNYNFRDVDYRKAGDWIFVIVGDNLIKTCYRRNKKGERIYRKKREQELRGKF